MVGPGRREVGVGMGRRAWPVALAAMAALGCTSTPPTLRRSPAPAVRSSTPSTNPQPIPTLLRPSPDAASPSPVPSASASPTPSQAPSPGASPPAPSPVSPPPVARLAREVTQRAVRGPAGEALPALAGGLVWLPGGTMVLSDPDAHRLWEVAPDGAASPFAGSGQQGFADGDPLAARFNRPFGLAVDAEGNVLVADAGNHRIRVVSASLRRVGTLAGQGPAGHADGVASQARFLGPTALALAGDGQLWIADAGNHRLRVLSPQGQVSSPVGQGEAGASDGALLQARFSEPTALAFDGAKLLWVADAGNALLRRVDLNSGQVSTLPEAGASAPIALRYPAALAVDESGVLWVADPEAQALWARSPSGAWDGLSESSALRFSWQEPGALAFGPGGLWVLERQRLAQVSGF